MEMKTPDPRYAGQPFLRFLECYVLWCIAQLKETDERLLDEVTPQLSKALNRDGTWREIVEQHMEFSRDLPDALRRLWASNVARFAAMNAAPDPETFARQVVETNLGNRG